MLKQHGQNSSLYNIPVILFEVAEMSDFQKELNDEREKILINRGQQTKQKNNMTHFLFLTKGIYYVSLT